jgi:GTP cyclohydrolase II
LYDHVLKVNNVDLKDIHSECELQEVLKSQDKELGFNLDLKQDRDTISVFLSKEDLFKTF